MANPTGGAVASGKAVIRPELAQGFQRQLENDLDKSTSGISSKLGSIGKKAGAALAAGIAATATVAIGAAVKGLSEFGDFQKGIAEATTLLGTVGADQIKRLEDGVKDLSRELGFATDEINSGLYQALSAGVPENNVFDFLDVAGKAAVAGVTDIETAVDGISSTLNAFGLSADEASAVADSMFAAVAGGKTTFEELSSSLFNVAPSAAAAGVGFQEVNAAIATLTASGTPTSVATTQMRAAIVELTKGGTMAAEAFQQISGQTFPEFIAAGGTLQDALGMMQGSAEGSGQSLLDMFGSVEAGQAAMVLATSGSGKFTAELERQAKAAGSVDQAFETMDATVSRQFEKLKATAEVALINIGAAIAPVALMLVDAILPIIDTLAPIFADIATIIGESLGPVITTLTPILKEIAGTISGVLGDVIPPLADAFGGLLTAVGPVITEALKLFGDLLTALTPMLPPLVSVFEAVAQILTDVLAPILGVIIEAISKVVDAVAPFITQFVDALKPGIEAVSKALSGIDWDPMIDALVLVATSVAGILPLLGELIGELLTALAPILPVIAEAFMSIVTALAPVIELFVEMSKDVLRPLIPQIAGLVTQLVEGIAPILPQVAQAFTQLIEALMPLLPPLIKLSQSFLPIMVELMEILLPLVIDLVNLGMAIWINSMTKLVEVITPVIEWLSELLTVVVDQLQPAISNLSENFTTGWQAIKDAVQGAWDRISSIWEDLKTGIQTVRDFVGEKVEQVVGFFTGLPDRIGSAISGIWDGLTDSFKNALNNIIDMWNGLRIPSFTVGGFDTPFGTTPGFDTPEINFPDIPRFAAGGVITEPTIGLMGETAKARPEIVTPEALMRDVFSDVLASQSSGGGPQIVNNFQTQRYSAAELADEVAFRQARQLTGRQR